MVKLVLFDHDDLDGAGCRILFSIAHSHMTENVDYLIVNCTNTNVNDMVNDTIKREDIDENTEIYFTDISASREVLELLVTKFKTVKIFDHHRTNFFATWVIPDAVIVPENPLGVLESGTSLLFKHFCEIAENDPHDPRAKYFLDDKSSTNSFTMLSDLVENIRSYDTYDWKEKNNMVAKKLQTLFFLLGMERFCNRYISRIKNYDGGDIIGENDMDFVDARLENEQRIIESVGVDDIYDVSVKGLRAAFILSSAGANISELANQFLTKHPEYDMFIGFNFAKGGEYSFRCIRDDLDVGGTIALPIGGGGHPKAAGAPIPNAIRDVIVDTLIRNIDDHYHCNNNAWS